MAKLFGIELAPLSMPLHRRLETLAVIQWVFSFIFLGAICTAFTIWVAFTRFWPLTVIYGVWYIYDRKTPFQGGRRANFLRHLKVWQYFQSFFPLKLVKSCDLDPNKNYVFACHPHGVLCVSHFCSFATEGTGFSKSFPEINPHLLILDGHFSFPLYREYIMGSGATGCNRNSMEYILSKKGKGNAACLAVGGAIEALEAHPGQFTLNLEKRKGFVKIALQTGASLVPVFSFGENELYHQINNPAGSFVRRMQDVLTKYLGFSPPLFHGRGIFNYSFGLLPYRKPITTVVGKPLDIRQVPNPSPLEVEQLHKKYVAALQALFEKHKEAYGISELKHLKFF